MASTSALSSMQADISKKLIMSESLKTPSPPPTQDTRLPTTCSPEKTHHQNRVTHNKQSPESHPASVILQGLLAPKVDHGDSESHHYTTPMSSQDTDNGFMVQTMLEKERQFNQQRASYGGKLPMTSSNKPTVPPRGKKRFSTEQLRLLSRRIHPTLSYANSTSSLPLSSTEEHSRKRTCLPLPPAEEEPSVLFKTCSSLWKGEEMGEFNHDSIKCFSELLKLRLTQAKHKIMGGEQEGGYRGWSDTIIRLSPKRHQSVCPRTVGNGRRLFADSAFLSRNENGERARTHHKGILSDMDSLPLLPEKRDRKSRTPRTTKKKDCQTPKQRSQAAAVSPVTLEDGTRMFVCDPCNKRYKNRNGLAYHMDRCKYKVEKVKQEVEDKNAVVLCVCDSPSEDKGMMVQCDQCRTWLHLDCIGLSEDSLEDTYHCPRCINHLHSTPPLPTAPYHHCKDLVQLLEETSKEEPNNSSQFLDMFNLFGDDLVQDPMVEAALKDDHDAVWGQFEDNGELEPDTQPVVWDDFLFSPHVLGLPEPWSQLSEEDPLAYDSSLVDAHWDMHQTPSLLFSENTFSSALDEEFSATPMIDMSTPLGSISFPSPMAYTDKSSEGGSDSLLI